MVRKKTVDAQTSFSLPVPKAGPESRLKFRGTESQEHIELLWLGTSGWGSDATPTYKKQLLE